MTIVVVFNLCYNLMELCVLKSVSFVSGFHDFCHSFYGFQTINNQFSPLCVSVSNNPNY